jgi:endonuclease-3
MKQIKTKNNKQEDLIYEALKKARETGLIAKGILETTRAVEKGTAKLVVIAKNVKPKNLISHLPNLCRYKNISFVWISSKEKLGKVIGLEIPSTTCAVINEGKAEDLLKRLATSDARIRDASKKVTYVGKEPINLLSIDRIEKQIWFQQKFAKPILKGIKKGTLRLGKRIPAKLNLPIFISETRKKLTDANIEILIWLKYKDIQKYPEIMEREYPSDIKKLDKEMRKIYPELSSESWVTFYGFDIIKENALSKKGGENMEEIKDRLQKELNKVSSPKEKIKRYQERRRLFEVLCQLAEKIPYNSIQTYPRPDHPDPEKKGDPFRCLVSIIISQRTTLEKEMKAGAQLFAKYKTPQEIASASVKEIAELIKPAGMAENKARAIIEVAKKILSRYQGNLEVLREKPIREARQEIMELPGVGPKSADCFLELGLGMPSLAIDINVYRTTKRLGFALASANREKVKEILESLIPRDIEIYRALHTYFLALGKYYCKAKPKCQECPVTEWCKYFSKHQNNHA